MKKISLILVLCLIFGTLPVNAAYDRIDQSEIKVEDLEFTPLDLTKAVNMGFADDVEGDGKGGWLDQGSANDFSSFALRGETYFRGVKFNIIEPKDNDGKSAIVLRGQNNQFFPISAEIEVNQKAGGVYFLHTSGWISDIVGTYTFVYDDGTSSEVKIAGNKDIFNWWGKASSDTCIPIWEGANGSTSQISLGMYACPNPHPDKTITKIVASTSGRDAYLVIVAATLTDKIPYIPSVIDYANPDTSTWWAYTQPNIDSMKGTILDMSHLLDAPAGKHGFVHTENDKMVFEDGTEFKFWGINVHDEMLFMSHSETDALVDWIAVSGFNLVRIHHMDGQNNHNSNIFGRSQERNTSLDEEHMDALCYFLSECKKRGIYWFIDNATSRKSYEDDNIQDYSTVDTAQKGYDAYDPIIQELHKQFSTELFNWYNPYTGLRIKDDPALIGTDLINENYLVRYPRPSSSYYAKQLDTLFTDWLKEKYKTDEAILAAWTQPGKNSVQEGESLAAGYKYDPKSEWSISAFAAECSEQRAEDTFNFQIYLQSKYIKERYQYFKDMGIKSLVTGGTNWGVSGSAWLNMNASTDFIDVHSYWHHPAKGWGVWAGTTFNETLSSNLIDPNMGTIGDVMNRAVYHKVRTLSEWNDCEPNPTTAETPLLLATYGRFQGCNPILFAASVYKEYIPTLTETANEKVDEVLTVFGNPLKMSGLPSAAFLSLSGAVKEPDKGYYHLYRNEDLSKRNKQTLSFDPWIGLIGKTGLVFEEQYEPSCSDDEVLKLAAEGKKSGVYTSITGELTTDRNKAIFSMNAETAQAAAGYINGETIETDDIVFHIDTEFSVNSIIAVDKQPIDKSEKMLLTTQARQSNTGMRLEKDFSAVLDSGTAPVLIEPVEGEIIIKNYNVYDVWVLNSSGQRLRKLMTEKTPEGYTKILLTKDNKTMNYEIVKKKQSNISVSNKKATYTQTEKASDMFNDITDAKTKQAAERLYALGMIRATGEKMFSPNQNITRGEFALWLMQALNPEISETLEFKDVPEGNAANKLRSLGVINDENLDAGNYLATDDMYVLIEKTLKFIGRKNTAIQREYQEEFVTRGAAAKVIYDILWK